jgi:L-alanine-DL-glutamate epimerase-like enolase superfamily enzyme
MLKISQVAQSHGVRVVPHAWKSGILKAASLHVNAILAGERIQEWSTADNPLSQNLVSTEQPVINGFAQVPTAPGLGVDVDESVVAQFHVSHSGGH